MPAKTPVKKAVPAKAAAKPEKPAAQPKAAVKPKAAKPKAAPKKPAPAAKKKVEAAPKEKLKKPKLVRDSFTMPEDEYQALVDIKKACIKAGFEIKKSELLRIGVALIRKTDPAQLKGLQAALPPLKAGRPKKDK